MPPADKKLVVFTSAEGAQRHDQPMAPQFAQEVIFGWLARYLQDIMTPRPRQRSWHWPPQPA